MKGKYHWQLWEHMVGGLTKVLWEGMCRAVRKRENGHGPVGGEGDVCDRDGCPRTCVPTNYNMNLSLWNASFSKTTHPTRKNGLGTKQNNKIINPWLFNPWNH